MNRSQYKLLSIAMTIMLLVSMFYVGREAAAYVAGRNVSVEEERRCVVIDPGHGGEDPGKVGINGANEKDVNLQIAQKVKKLLKKKNIKVIMTREDDTSLAKDGGVNRKVQDMKARVELINKTKPDLAVSIHQNSYHEEGICGAQVFYYTHSTDGERAAGIMQKALLAVDQENHRQEKADDGYYLLRRTEVPTIIVECGFLSNREEAEKLVDEKYQKKIAKAVVQGIEEFVGSREK